MISFGYQQNNVDHTLFIKHCEGMIVLFIIYVDDIVVTQDDIKEMTRLKRFLYQEFEIKNLKKLLYFLRIEVARSNEGIFIFQKNYILNLLEENSMMDCKLITSTQWYIS